jgi:hypothetical protein
MWYKWISEIFSCQESSQAYNLALKRLRQKNLKCEMSVRGTWATKKDSVTLTHKKLDVFL